MQRSRWRNPFLIVLLSAALLLTPVVGSSAALALDPQPEPPLPAISVWIDGRELTLDVAPLLENGRTLVPMRAIFESLGAEVEWDGNTQTITAKKGSITLILQPGKSTASKNESALPLDVPPRLYNGRALVPLRFVGEALGADVNWDGTTRQVRILRSSSGAAVPPVSKAPDSVMPDTPTPETETPDIDTPLIITPGLTIPGRTLPNPDPGANLNLRPRFSKGNPLLNFALEDDDAEIKKYTSLAKPLAKGENPAILPAKLDFSRYVTFVGSQDSWGGCIGRSTIQVMNILNEMENPYTPDLSFWYLHARQMQLYPNGDPDVKFQLENEGLCSEGAFPTDYDKVVFVDEVPDFSKMHFPTMGNFMEGKALYRVLYPNVPITPEVESIKAAMVKYGPVLAAGPFTIIQGKNPAVGHCITIIGYNDSAGWFSCLNSWGDQKHGGDGIFELPYDKVQENVKWIRYIEDLPSPRELSSHAYSGRIRLEGNYAYRSELTIKVGVEGQEPFTVWDSPNQKQCIDLSYNLSLDFALPLYAAECWPPDNTQRWYIDIINDNKTNYDPDDPEYIPSGVFIFKEFTLARLYKDNGAAATETFSALASVGKKINNGVTRIYIPDPLAPTKLEVKPLLPIRTIP